MSDSVTLLLLLWRKKEFLHGFVRRWLWCFWGKYFCSHEALVYLELGDPPGSLGQALTLPAPISARDQPQNASRKGGWEALGWNQWAQQGFPLVVSSWHHTAVLFFSMGSWSVWGGREGGSLISCRDSFAQEGHSKSYKSQKQNWEKKIPERDQVVLPCRVQLVFTHPDTALNPKSEAQRRVLEGSKGISCLKLN